MDLKIAIQYNFSDYLKLNIWQNFVKRLNIIVLFFVVIFGFNLYRIYSGNFVFQAILESALVAFLYFLGPILLLFVFVYLRTKKLCKQDSLFNEKTTIEISNSAIIEKTIKSEIKIEFSDIVKIVEFNKCIFVFMSDLKASIIPSRCCATLKEYLAVYSYLKSKIK